MCKCCRVYEPIERAVANLFLYFASETEFSNPQETEAFARHLLERHIDVGIISMAWKTIEKPRKLTRAPGKPDMDALTCWVARLMPLTEAEPGREILVALCNQSGFENDIMY